MQHCVRCAYPSNHALGISFNEDGLCSGCTVHEEKNTLNWDEREKKLVSILDQYRDPTQTCHDCIIPVSGGKDSFFIVDLIKNKYGLNPLLVSYNRHYNTRGGVHNLEQIRTAIGCDIIAMTPQPDSVYRLMRYSLEHKGSIHWPYLAGSTVFPVQMAVRKKTPLIIWGAHQGVDQVGMFSHLDEVEMTRRYRKEHDLMGLEPEDITPDGKNLFKHDLTPLFYPQDNVISQLGVRGIYLNNYIRWDTKAQHEKMHKKYDIYAAEQMRTFDHYNDADCQIYNSLHDVIKQHKFGYSKINDHVAREIRFGRLQIEDGLKLIQHYQSRDAVDTEAYAHATGLNMDAFWDFINAHSTAACEINISEKDKDRGRLKKQLPDEMEFLTNIPREIADSPKADRLLMRGGIAA